MEIRKKVILIGFLITLFLFISIIFLGAILDKKREERVDFQMQNIYKDMEDIQKLMLMSEVYGNDMACLAFKQKLKDLDQKTWTLGMKIEQYRIATEEFSKNSYYVDQKKLFNENQLIYLTLLTKIKKQCDYHQAIISFFYQNSADCKKCDDQSFVLTDINDLYDEEISIFSFDLDLNISTVDLLKQYYKIDQLPCVVINEKPYCGIQDKKFIEEKICETTNLSFCNNVTKPAFNMSMLKK
jgi:hypothetical protein